MRMAADNHIDIGNLCNTIDITLIADMGEGDDLVDALLGQFFRRFGDRRNVIAKSNMLAG